MQRVSRPPSDLVQGASETAKQGESSVGTVTWEGVTVGGPEVGCFDGLVSATNGFHGPSTEEGQERRHHHYQG